MTNYIDYLQEKGLIKESRVTSDDVIYNLDKTKEVIEVTLKGSKYASYATKIARQYENLKNSAEKIKDMIDKKNTEIKDHAKSLLDANDIVNQLIIKTSQTAVTISKATEQKSSEVVDYKLVFEKLINLYTGDNDGLVRKMRELEKEFTTIKVTKEQDYLSRGMRVKNKEWKKVNPSKEELDESFNLEKFVEKIKDLYNKFKEWKSGFLSQLEDVKKLFNDTKKAKIVKESDSTDYYKDLKIDEDTKKIMKNNLKSVLDSDEQLLIRLADNYVWSDGSNGYINFSNFNHWLTDSVYRIYLQNPETKNNLGLLKQKLSYEFSSSPDNNNGFRKGENYIKNKNFRYNPNSDDFSW